MDSNNTIISLAYNREKNKAYTFDTETNILKMLSL